MDLLNKLTPWRRLRNPENGWTILFKQHKRAIDRGQYIFWKMLEQLLSIVSSSYPSKGLNRNKVIRVHRKEFFPLLNIIPPDQICPSTINIWFPRGTMHIVWCAEGITFLSKGTYKFFTSSASWPRWRNGMKELS